MRLFGREYRLTLGTSEISGLDIDFEVSKSTKREPNKAKITVYNLAKEHRRGLESGENIRVKLEAGYRDPGPSLLFLGDIRAAASPRGLRVSSELSGPDVGTTIEADDGGRSYLSARVSRSFPPGTRPGPVLRYLASALGLGLGNIPDFETRPLEGAGNSFEGGTVLSGSAYQEMDGIIRSLGLRWSIQNGIVQIQERGRPIQSSAVVLSPSSGLIGSPVKDHTGKVKAVGLIQPGLDPGRAIVLESSEVSGSYEVVAVQYVGAIPGNDWYAKLDLRPY